MTHLFAVVLATTEFDDANFVTASMAKYWTTDKQCEIVDTCLQLHGGAGYMDEYEITRHYRDARVSRIYAGTSEIMKEIIGRGLGLDDQSR